MKNKQAMLLSAGVIVSAGALATYLSMDSPTAPSHTPQEAAFAPASLEAQTCSLRVGEVTSYAWRVTEHARIDTAALGLGPKGMAPTENKQTSRFTLTTRVLDASDASAVLLGRMSEVSSDVVTDDERLEAPFLLEVTRDCQVTSFAYLSTTHRGYARHQQRFVFDMAWRSGAHEMEGETSMGQVKATVTSGLHRNKLETVRTARSYELWPHQNRTPIALDAGMLTVAHSGQGLFDTARLEERFTGEHVTLTREAHAERVGPKLEVLDDAPTDQTRYTWENLLPLEIQVPMRDPLVAARAKEVKAARGVPLKEVLDDHIARNEAEEPIQRAWPPLRNWLEANPERTPELIAALKKGDMADRAQMTAYMALGDAQTPEAKKELVAIMDDKAAPLVQRSRSIVALINRPDTGVDLAESLSGYALQIDSGALNTDRAFARQSMLALGAMSGYKTQNKEVREVALRTARSALSTTQEPMSRRPVYGAIANLGDPKNLSMVSDIPSHPDRNMRKAAARIFRRMHPVHTNAFVEGWLRQETSMQVKRELYDTLELQTYDTKTDPSDAILRIAMVELEAQPGIATRKSLILLLSRALGRRPADPLGLRPVLERAAAREMQANSGLYIYAAKHLESARLLEMGNALSRDRVNPTILPGVGTKPTISTTRRLP